MNRLNDPVRAWKPSRRGPVATLLSGSAIAFVIGYAAKIVLLRLYPPAAFGVFDFIVSTVGILVPVASLRYEDAIVLPERDDDAREVLSLSAWITAIVVGLVAAAVLVIVQYDLFSGLDEVAPWFWTIPILLLVLRASKLWELWLTRRELFGRMAAGTVIQSVTMTVTRVLAGLRSAGPAGLIGGFGLGHAITAGWYGSIAVADLRSVPGRASVSGMRTAASRYRRFALFSTPASLLSALTTRLPFLLLLVLYSAEVLGQFGQAFNIVYVPLSLVTAAIGQVFFVRAAASIHTGDLAATTRRTHDRLVALVLFPVATVAVAGPDVFQVLFGPEWRTAGQYATWLAAWLGLSAIASPLTRLFDVLQRQRTDLALHVLLFAAVAIALVAGYRSGDPALTIIYLGIAGATARSAQIFSALSLAGLRAAGIIRPYVVRGLPAAAAMAVLAGVRFMSGPVAVTAAFFFLLAVFGIVNLRRGGLFSID